MIKIIDTRPKISKTLVIIFLLILSGCFLNFLVIKEKYPEDYHEKGQAVKCQILDKNAGFYGGDYCYYFDISYKTSQGTKTIQNFRVTHETYLDKNINDSVWFHLDNFLYRDIKLSHGMYHFCEIFGWAFGIISCILLVFVLINIYIHFYDKGN